MSERVMITGSSGFIGSHLAEELLEHDFQVFGADLHQPRVAMPHRTTDLAHPGAAMAAIEAAKPDIVVHLAAQVGREFGERDITHTVQSNAAMTAQVANAAAAQGARLVYASTSEIYGDNRHSLCDELDGPFSLPHNVYGLSKRWGEEACQLYAPEGLTVLRFSMPYGPGVPPGRGRAALPNVLWQAATRQRIPIHEGSRRSWCWIGDTVRAVRLIIEKGAPGPYNVGRDDAEITMLQCAQIACTMTDAPLDLIDTIAAPAKQTVVKRLATERIRALGWKPEVELREGMERILEWVQRFDARGKLAA